jgi:hypothetical protein
MSLASHIISKGSDQSGAVTIGAVTNLCFKILKAFKQSSLNWKGVSFTSKLVRGFAIFEKSLINLL